MKPSDRGTIGSGSSLVVSGKELVQRLPQMV